MTENEKAAWRELRDQVAARLDEAGFASADLGQTGFLICADPDQGEPGWVTVALNWADTSNPDDEGPQAEIMAQAYEVTLRQRFETVARFNGFGAAGPDTLVTVAEEYIDPDRCPGCGCLPGDGVTASCFAPLGCGDSKLTQTQEAFITRLNAQREAFAGLETATRAMNVAEAQLIAVRSKLAAESK